MLSFSIHNKRKHNAQSSCLKLAILILGQYRNAFLAYLLNSRKRLQRYEKNVRWKMVYGIMDLRNHGKYGSWLIDGR